MQITMWSMFSSGIILVTVEKEEKNPAEHWSQKVPISNYKFSYNSKIRYLIKATNL